jgi:hypothetical protein
MLPILSNPRSADQNGTPVSRHLCRQPDRGGSGRVSFSGCSSGLLWRKAKNRLPVGGHFRETQTGRGENDGHNPHESDRPTNPPLAQRPGGAHPAAPAGIAATGLVSPERPQNDFLATTDRLSCADGFLGRQQSWMSPTDAFTLDGLSSAPQAWQSTVCFAAAS